MVSQATRRSKQSRPQILVTFALAAIMVAASSTALAGNLQLPVATAAPGCAQALASALPAEQGDVEELGLDQTNSTSSPLLRKLYREAAFSVLERSASERAALRIVAFGASGVGSTPVFEGSFAPTSSDDLYNLAAANTARCSARRAIEVALHQRAKEGSDVAGTAAALIEDARRLVAPGKPATVTLITDGCQAPSRTGANSHLTDLCGELAAGRSARSILAAHRSEFALPDAHGVTLAMRGVGVGRHPERANTTRARRLTAFWRLVCRQARARACLIGSELP